ncbi:GNAT family N-acetyltransferase [Allokutzneria albata]|uniref:Acetyltransferase (GNAT) family protein n=1 Tax=Allokutzneria albata TaxID=211114 RepID=A0A1G9Y7G0_ALLAB|nr:GNAT family N-acetyltransferase [Allokutzneria albata]SDN05112.1 Acetyltransferase (GNAT) family protein [Allokutzneria albata]
MTTSESQRRTALQKVLKRIVPPEQQALPSGHSTIETILEMTSSRRTARQGTTSLVLLGRKCAQLEDDPWPSDPMQSGRTPENCRWLSALAWHGLARTVRAGNRTASTFGTLGESQTTLEYWSTPVWRPDTAAVTLAVLDLLTTGNPAVARWYLETTSCGAVCQHHHPDGQATAEGTLQAPEWASMPELVHDLGAAPPAPRRARASARPPRAARTAPANRQPGVEFVASTDSVDRDFRCPCGWNERGEQHPRRHLEWSNGIPTPTAVAAHWPQDTAIAVVPTTAPAVWRQAAYRMAQLAQRDGGYDMVSFPYPGGRGQQDDANTRAVLYRCDNRIVGYLAVHDEPSAAQLNFADGHLDTTTAENIRPTVGLVFVPLHWRRRGIATALVRAAADHAACAPAELAWSLPFSNHGRALAQTVAAGSGRVWVA